MVFVSPRGARAHPCGCTRDALARVLAHYLCKRFRPFGARARVGIWVVYNRRWDRGYLYALVKLAPLAQVKLPSAVKLASQVKFAFFRKNARCATGRRPPPWRARAPRLRHRRAAPCASRKGAAFTASGALLSSGWSAKKGKTSVFVCSPRPRAHPCGCTRAYACTRACALLQALSPRGEGACRYLGGI